MTPNTLYKKRDLNESSGTRASRNHCRCGKHDPHVAFASDWERIERYECDMCKENKFSKRSDPKD